MIVLDPYNEIDHRKYGSEATTDYVGSAIKKLKRFAKNYHVHLMVVAHPTKLAENQDGTLPIPNLYNLEDSRHWYNKADLGVVIYRSGAVTTIRVAKSRYQEIIGKTGQVPFYFMEDNGKYHEAEDL